MNPSYRKSSLPSKRKISEEFTLKRATGYGEFNLVADYLDSLGFSGIVEKRLELQKASWARHPLTSMVEMMVLGFACGLERRFHFQWIQEDPLITHKRGGEALPHHI